MREGLPPPSPLILPTHSTLSQGALNITWGVRAAPNPDWDLQGVEATTPHRASLQMSARCTTERSAVVGEVVLGVVYQEVRTPLEGGRAGLPLPPPRGRPGKVEEPVKEAQAARDTH